MATTKTAALIGLGLSLFGLALVAKYETKETPSHTVDTLPAHYVQAFGNENAVRPVSKPVHDVMVHHDDGQTYTVGRMDVPLQTTVHLAEGVECAYDFDNTKHTLHLECYRTMDPPLEHYLKVTMAATPAGSSERCALPVGTPVERLPTGESLGICKQSMPLYNGTPEPAGTTQTPGTLSISGSAMLNLGTTNAWKIEAGTLSANALEPCPIDKPIPNDGKPHRYDCSGVETRMVTFTGPVTYSEPWIRALGLFQIESGSWVFLDHHPTATDLAAQQIGSVCGIWGEHAIWISSDWQIIVPCTSPLRDLKCDADRGEANRCHQFGKILACCTVSSGIGPWRVMRPNEAADVE